MPLRKDWKVLDALNYIKDEVDGTLSFRWSCRMGDLRQLRHERRTATPKLTCDGVLSDYGPARSRSSRSPTSRSSAISSSTSTDFMEKLAAREALDDPRRTTAAVDGEYLQTPEAARRLQAVQHVHQLHALLRRVPGLRPGAGLRRPGRDRARPPLQHGLPGRGRAERLDVLVEHEGVWGCTFVGECTRVLPQARRPGGRDPALQGQGRQGVGEGLPAAPGRR